MTVKGETLTCTPEHPFYVPKKGWTSSVDLRAGDILVMLNGEYVVVEQVQHELLESPETTYNFEVEDFHTYYVGEISVLVHNECTPSNSKNYSPEQIAKKYDITVEQSAPKLITCEGIGVDVIASKDGYGCHWMVLNNSNGIWYQFYPLEREKTGQYDDEFFDLTIINTNYMAVPYDNHLTALKETVDSYLSLSPVHEILGHIRLDEYGESNDISEITAESFLSCMSMGKLQFNKIYRVVR